MSDNGPQMRSHTTREFMAACAIMQRFGRPGTPTDQAWIESFFSHIKGEWPHLETIAEPSLLEVRDILLGHLEHLHAFYGELSGVRIARKHLGWYAKDRPENAAFRHVVNRAESAIEQARLTRDYFDALIAGVAPTLSAAA